MNNDQLLGVLVTAIVYPSITDEECAAAGLDPAVLAAQRAQRVIDTALEERSSQASGARRTG
jgi:hypothetical protein